MTDRNSNVTFVVENAVGKANPFTDEDLRVIAEAFEGQLTETATAAIQNAPKTGDTGVLFFALCERIRRCSGTKKIQEDIK